MADYVCGATAALGFPTCTAIGGHSAIDVNIVGGGGGTPAPQSTGVVVLNTPGVTVQNTPGVSVVNFPAPGPTSTALIPLVQVTNLPNPLPVTTPVPIATAATLIPMFVICDPTTGNRCAALSSTPNGSDSSGAGSQAVDVNAYAPLFNGSTWDRPRSAVGTGAPVGVHAVGYNASGADAPVIGKTDITGTITSATTTLLVSATSAKRIYPIAITLGFIGTTGATAQLEYGTQSTNPCDTGTTVVGGVYVLTTGTTLIDEGGQNLIGTISGTNVQECLLTTGTITDIYYRFGYEKF